MQQRFAGFGMTSYITLGGLANHFPADAQTAQALARLAATVDAAG